MSLLTVSVPDCQITDKMNCLEIYTLIMHMYHKTVQLVMCTENLSQTTQAETSNTPKQRHTSFSYRSTYPRNINKNKHIRNSIYHKTTDLKMC